MSRVHRRGMIVGLGASLLSGSLVAQTARSGRLRAADTQAVDFPTVQALLYIDRFLRNQTESGLSLQVFAGAQLGEENEIVEQTRAGAIDLARINTASLANRAPICSLFCLPDLIQSDKHLDAVLESRFAEEVAAALDDIGLVLLTFYDSGARSIYNRRQAIHSPTDLQGMSIRIQSCDVMKRFVEALGARPVELGFSQLLSALQAGLVDGAENNWPSYVTTDHYIAAPFLTLTEHARPPEALVIAKSRWSSMTLTEQGALRTAAQASRIFMRARWREWTGLSKRLAAQAHVDVVRTFAREEFMAALRPMQETWIDELKLANAAELVLRMRS